MMFNKALPPAYLAFESNELWKICCFLWGDTELVQGKVAEGSITCDGASIVYSDYIFAHCTAIPSHKLSNGQTFSESAATQNFSVNIIADSSSTFSSFDDGDTVITIMQYSGTTGTSLATVTKADWVSGASNNQITVNVTTTNACKYLQVGVLGANNSAVSWSINAITGSRQPLGITANQCAAVTSIGAYFVSNNAIERFDSDSLYFTSLQTINTRAFIDVPNCLYVRLPYTTNIRYGDGYNYSIFTSTNIAVRIDSATAIGALFNGRSAYSNYTVITTSEVPSCSSAAIYATHYVLDELVSDYQSATNWSAKTIKSIHDLPTDHPDCPWIADLMAKGLIPSN